MMNRTPVLVAWAVGLGFAVLASAIGPEQLLLAAQDLLAQAAAALDGIALLFGRLALGTVRGLAIGVFVTFLVLCGLASRQGRPARGALVVVSLLWIALVMAGDYARWDLALLLAGIAALVMTRRVLV